MTAELPEHLRPLLKTLLREAGSGLGDRVASALSAAGITKDRAQAVASAVGVKDCGCAKRQAALNAIGERYLGLPAGSTAPPSDIEPAP